MKRISLKTGLIAVAAIVLSSPAPSLAQSANPQAVSMYNLGLTAYKQGSPESAIIFFKRATDIDPNLADAQYNLGVIYQTQKRGKEAIPRFLEVLRIKPSDPDAHFQLGVLYQDLGQIAEARQHFSSIPPNNPHFPEAQGRIAQLANQMAGGQPPVNAATMPQTTPGYQNPAVAQTVAGNAYSTGQTASQGIAYQPGQYGAGQLTASGQYPATGNQYSPDGAMANNIPPGTQPNNETTPYATTNALAANSPAVQQYAQPVQSSTQQAQGQAPMAPVAVPNPVPVLANTSLRIVATGFNAPAGLAFDKTGNLYVANFLSNTIDRISSDGTRTQFSSGANLKGPIGLTVDDNNNLFVANYNSGNVARISPAGVATIIATGFRKPYYVTLDHDGNLYVSQQEDNSIVRITLPRPVSARPQ